MRRGDDCSLDKVATSNMYEEGRVASLQVNIRPANFRIQAALEVARDPAYCRGLGEALASHRAARILRSPRAELGSA
jgi:hypothetical protein